MATCNTHANTSKTQKRGRKPIETANQLLSMGKTYPAIDGWRVVLATVPLYFVITPEIIEKSKKNGGSGRFCVVALAMEAVFGKDRSFQVGTVFTKIWDTEEKVEVRFRTPPGLAKYVRMFDNGEGWQLPPNIYRLAPTCPGDRTNSRNRPANKIVKVKVKGATRTPVRRKPRAHASRTVLRNTRIRWADVDLMG